MSRENHLYFNAFNQIPQIGSVRFRRLLNYFPDLEAAWSAPASELAKSGIEESVVEKIVHLRAQIEPYAEFEKLEKHGASMIVFSDRAYPKLLREIPNPPMVLYIRGETKLDAHLAVAIVGTRRFTSYGRQVTEDLAIGLAGRGITVISGLAFGIDALAHETTLRSRGRTIGVLACGVDSIYPANNRLLGERIIENGGAVISELPLGAPPLKHHFPNRNRIISGLALGTVVVEAGIESGSLITARHALEQNRQVYAVPGSIYSPLSEGPNNLLKMGAKPITKAADILEDLNLEDATAQMTVAGILADNDEEQKILAILTREPIHFDQIVKQGQLSAPTVAATLTIMEMKGKVKNLGANQYVVSR
ncbi:MAG: DNA-processing protein DprA [bacterium]|nr:DNA-processing protein DprA [bacterium]